MQHPATGCQTPARRSSAVVPLLHDRQTGLRCGLSCIRVATDSAAWTAEHLDELGALNHQHIPAEEGTGYVQDGGQDISFDLYAQCIQLSGAACEVVGKGHLSTLARQVGQGAAWSNISLLTSSATTQPHYRVVRRHASRWFLSDPLQMKAQRITTADVVRELRRPDMQAAILSGRPLKAVTAGVIRHGLDAQAVRLGVETDGARSDRVARGRAGVIGAVFVEGSKPGPAQPPAAVTPEAACRPIAPTPEQRKRYDMHALDAQQAAEELRAAYEPAACQPPAAAHSIAPEAALQPTSDAVQPEEAAEPSCDAAACDSREQAASHPGKLAGTAARQRKRRRERQRVKKNQQKVRDAAAAQLASSRAAELWLKRRVQQWEQQRYLQRQAARLARASGTDCGQTMPGHAEPASQVPPALLSHRHRSPRRAAKRRLRSSCRRRQAVATKQVDHLTELLKVVETAMAQRLGGRRARRAYSRRQRHLRTALQNLLGRRRTKVAEKAQPVDDQGNEQGSKRPEPAGKDNVEPMAEDLTEASSSTLPGAASSATPIAPSAAAGATSAAAPSLGSFGGFDLASPALLAAAAPAASLAPPLMTNTASASSSASAAAPSAADVSAPAGQRQPLASTAAPAGAPHTQAAPAQPTKPAGATSPPPAPVPPKPASLAHTDVDQVFVKRLDGGTTTININMSDSTTRLKLTFQKQSGWAMDEIALEYGGRWLVGGLPLSAYGISPEATIHQRGRLRGGAPGGDGASSCGVDSKQSGMGARAPPASSARMGEVLGDIVLTCPGRGDDLCYEAGVQLSDVLDAATRRFGAGSFSYKKGEKTYTAASGSRVPEGTYEWKLDRPAAGQQARGGGYGDAGKLVKGKLPFDFGTWELLGHANLPAELRDVLALPLTWLESLSASKLRVLAYAYLALRFQAAGGPDPGQVDVLVAKLMVALQACNLQPDKAEPLEEAREIPAHLHMTGRSDALTTALRTWLDYWQDDQRGPLIMTCHETGMGKSVFAQALNDPPVHLAPAVAAAVRSFTDIKGIISLLCAERVVVKSGYIPPPSRSQPHLSVALQLAVARACAAQYPDVAEYAGTPQASLAFVIEMLIRRAGRPLYLVWDEFQCFEKGVFQEYYKDLLDRAPTRKQRAVIPAYAVWDELAMLIRTEPHFYTYACGTSCNLAMIGKKLLSNIGYSSPTDTLVQILRPLTIQEIFEVLTQTRLSDGSASLFDALGLAGADAGQVRYVLERIRGLTAGIPKLVREGIRVCWLCDLNLATVSGTTLQELFSPSYSADLDVLYPALPLEEMDVDPATPAKPSRGSTQAAPNTPVTSPFGPHPPSHTPPTVPSSHADHKSPDWAWKSVASHLPVLRTALDQASKKHLGLIARWICRQCADHSWQSDKLADLGLPVLTLHAIFRMAFVLTGTDEQRVSQLDVIQSCSAHYTEVSSENGTRSIMLCLPEAILYNRVDTLLPDFLSCLRGTLRDMVAIPPDFLCDWRLMEVLLRDVLLVKLVDRLRTAQQATLQDILPFLVGDPTGNMAVHPPDGQQATHPMISLLPGFGSADPLQLKSPQQRTALLQAVTAEPWSTVISAEDAGFWFSNVFRRNTVGHPKPGSAGPDLLYWISDVLQQQTCMLMFSVKFNSTTKLSAQQVVQDVRYAVNVLSSMEGVGDRLSCASMVVVAPGCLDDKLHALVGRPVAGVQLWQWCRQVLSGLRRQVVPDPPAVPETLTLHIVHQEQLQGFFGPELSSEVYKILDRRASKTFSDSPITKVLTQMQQMSFR